MAGRVFIADDEKLARERLRRLLEDSPFEVVGEAENGEQTLKAVATLAPDILLLDIRMPGKDGLETAAELSETAYPPAIIFVTAYDAYLMQAFQVRAQNYLLKPVRREALLKALETASQVTRAQLRTLENDLLQRDDEPTLAVQDGDTERRIPLAEVICLQAENKYVTLHTLSGDVLCDDSLKELESRFPDLVRIHRNTLINPQHVIALQRGDTGLSLKMRATSQALVVSRRLARSVRQQLMEAPED